jgi:hypothetical protein
MFSKNYFKKFLGILFIIVCFFYAIGPLFRNLGPGEVIRHIDTRATYVSGICWLSGRSPYNPDIFKQVWEEKMVNEVWQSKLEKGRVVLPYPPTLGVIAIPLALYSWETATQLFDVLNVFFLWLTALFTALLMRDTQPNWLILSFGIGLSLIFQLPYTTAVFVVGQNSLIATAGCLGAVYFAQHRQFWRAALGILLASIKPHVSICTLVYLLITSRNWRLLGWSSLIVGLTSLVVLTLGRDYNPLPEILDSMGYYRANVANSTALLPGLHFLLGTIGFTPQMVGLLPVVGLFLVVMLSLLVRKRETVASQKLLLISLTFCLTALFMPIHHYDYTIFFLVTTLLVAVKWYFVMLLIPGIFLVARPSLAEQLINHFTHFSANAIIMGSVASIYLALVIGGMIIWYDKKVNTEA